MNSKVLIIDDDKEFSEELRETLVLSGYDVVVINDAELSLDSIDTIKPNVILLDLKMPKKSGFQIASELRRFSELSIVPIIAMTGFFKSESIQILLQVFGIQDFLQKPFTPLDAISKIESVLV